VVYKIDPNKDAFGSNGFGGRVARWLKTKISIWDILGHGMDNVGIFYDQLEHFTAIWYIL
jgi:hypothetical protein